MALQLQQPVLWPAGGYALAALLGAGAWLLLRWRIGRVWGLGCLAWGITGLHACAMPEPIDPSLEGRDLDVVGRVVAMAQPLSWKCLPRKRVHPDSSQMVLSVAMPEL